MQSQLTLLSSHSTRLSFSLCLSLPSLFARCRSLPLPIPRTPSSNFLAPCFAVFVFVSSSPSPSASPSVLPRSTLQPVRATHRSHSLSFFHCTSRRDDSPDRLRLTRCRCVSITDASYLFSTFSVSFFFFFFFFFFFYAFSFWRMNASLRRSSPNFVTIDVPPWRMYRAR